jgi:DNA-binding response OmpR family regulator
MSKRARILVVDSDLHVLSKIYLSLIHKDYKVEATDDAQEIVARTERFKPRLIILSAATRNLTSDVCRDVEQRRVKVLMITKEEGKIPCEIKKMEVVRMPSDVSFFDGKIRELLNIVE